MVWGSMSVRGLWGGVNTANAIVVRSVAVGEKAGFTSLCPQLQLLGDMLLPGAHVTEWEWLKPYSN